MFRAFGTFLGLDITERAPVQKKGKERGKSWLINGPSLLLVLIVVVSTLCWFATRESSALALKYGELKEILHYREGVSFTNVKVDKDEIRGQIVTRTPIIDGDK